MIKKTLVSIIFSMLIFISVSFAEAINVECSRVPLKINAFEAKDERYKLIMYNDIIYVPIHSMYDSSENLFSNILNVYYDNENVKNDSEALNLIKFNEAEKEKSGGEKFLFDAEKQTFSYEYINDNNRYEYGCIYTLCSFFNHLPYVPSYISEIIESAAVIDRDVYICGQKYENNEYPFLKAVFGNGKYRVIYMPLTYEIGSIFGWDINYDIETGLSIYLNGHSSCYNQPSGGGFAGMLGTESHMFTSGKTSIYLNISLYPPHNYTNRSNRLYIREGNEALREIEYEGEWLLGCVPFYGISEGAYTYGATISYENRLLTINGVQLVSSEEGFEETTADIVIDVDTGEEVEVKNIRVSKFEKWEE